MRLCSGIHAFTQYLKAGEIGDSTTINAAAEEMDRSDEIKKSKDRLKARMNRR